MAFGEIEEHVMSNKVEVNIMDALKPPSLNKVRKEKKKAETNEAMMKQVDEALLNFINAGAADDGTAEVSKRILAAVNCFNPCKAKDALNVATTTAGADPSGWEVVKAIADSGATVPVVHPKTGRAYEVTESSASKAGVEYAMANDATVPNLGEKRMAVLTAEGTVRGYSSQCADVAKTLQSVREMVSSKHAVCFGLGSEGDQHLIINKLTGEVNKMEDDGINYLQHLLVIPPDQIEAVQARVQQLRQAQVDPGSAQDFPGRGR